MWSRFFRFPAVALSASFFGIKKFRAYPSETSRTSPRRPSFCTSSSRMTFMARPNLEGNPRRVPLALLVGRDVRQQRDRARALDGVGERALVPRAAAGDAAWNDLAALGDEAAQ